MNIGHAPQVLWSDLLIVANFRIHIDDSGDAASDFGRQAFADL